MLTIVPVIRALAKLMTGMEMGVPTSLEAAKAVGQDIAWMTLYGHMSTMLARMPESPDMYPEEAKTVYGEAARNGATHVVDMEWMVEYEPKPDFCRYGGRAFFRIREGCLELQYLTWPQRNNLIAVNPENDVFTKVCIRYLCIRMTSCSHLHPGCMPPRRGSSSWHPRTLG
jgi:hypothetical protein